jgi:hypothetical protein
MSLIFLCCNSWLLWYVSFHYIFSWPEEFSVKTGSRLLCMCVHSYPQNERNGLFHLTSQTYDKLHPLKFVGLVAQLVRWPEIWFFFPCDFFYRDWLWYIALFLMGTEVTRRWSNCSFGVHCSTLYSTVCMGRLKMKSLYLWWESLALNYQILWLFTWLLTELEGSLFTFLNNSCHIVL